MIFPNRVEAGRRLAALLFPHVDENAIVLGLPRGGVVVAAEVAAALQAPLDVWVVRKIGAPNEPELGLGAVAEGSGVFLDTALAQLLGVDARELAALVSRETIELHRRVRAIRRGRPPPTIQGRTVILIDDGLATGGTARAAIQALRTQRPARLVFAVPVAASDSIERLRPEVDEIVCVQSIAGLRSIGEWYTDFAQTPGEEVTALLERAEDQGPVRS